MSLNGFLKALFEASRAPTEKRKSSFEKENAFGEFCLKVSDQIKLTKLINMITTELAVKFLVIRICVAPGGLFNLVTLFRRFFILQPFRAYFNRKNFLYFKGPQARNKKSCF